jgi:hypothetical protein
VLELISLHAGIRDDATNSMVDICKGGFLISSSFIDEIGLSDAIVKLYNLV